MRKNFKKNDNLLFHAFTVIDVVAILLGLSSLLYGVATIVYAIDIANTWLIVGGIMIIVILSPIIGLAFWVLNTVTLYMYCDIKLIRNKLYGKSNDYLAPLTESKESSDEKQKELSYLEYDSQPRSDRLDSATSILQSTEVLKALLDEGILTQEEFHAEKRRILDQNSASVACLCENNSNESEH